MTGKISWWRTSFGEEEVERLRMSVRAEHISAGPVTAELEKRIAQALNIPYAVMTTSGSAALFLALRAVGVQEGDEVIVPDRTWVATAHAVILAGAKPVLVDVRADVPLIDVDRIEEKITPRTKALLPVHLNGRTADMKKLREIAGRRGLKIVEDACQAFFVKDQSGFLGTGSDAGCFSLSVAKLISTGQGGCVVTHDKNICEQLKAVRNNGVADIFTETWNQFGFNLKFTDLLASFGLVQLDRASGRIKRLKEVYERYRAGIPETDAIKLLPSKIESGEFPLYPEILCGRRKKLVGFLAGKGIQVRPVPPSLDISSYIESSGDFPNARIFAERGVYLPGGPEQPIENVDRVLEALRDFSSRE